jgi:hypothetical protein
MADKWPLANGNYSTAANWNGGTLPVDGDDIYMDGRTIQWDQSVILPNARLLTTARAGGTAGGGLTVTVPTTADLTLLAIVTGSSTPLNIAANFTGTIIVATATGSATSANINAISLSVGVFAITFINCTFVGSVGPNRTGLTVSGGAGTVTFVNCTARGGVGGQGVSIQGGTSTITGVLNLQNASGATAQALGLSVVVAPVILSGTCVMSGNVGLVTVSAGSTLQYTCTSLTFVSALNSNIATFNFSAATTGNILNFTTPVTMHNQSSGPNLAVLSTVGGKVCVTGDITGGTGAPSLNIFVVTNGTLERIGEDITGNAVTANSLCSLTNNSNSFFIADKIRCGAGGHLMLPTGVGVRFKSTSRIIAQDSAASPITLQAPAVLVDLPIPANVREGITYNNGTQTGTYDAGNEVAQAVWEYATRTITAGGLDAAGVRAAVGLASANLDSQLAPLSTGGGARTVTITVTLGGLPLEGATVRLSKGGESFTGSTNGSGQVVFNVDDGTWTVAITASGASFAGASLVVDGNEAATYAMVANTVPPATNPNTCRVQLIASRNVAAEKVRVLILSEGQSGRSGNNAFLNRAFDGETDANGQLLVDLPWSSTPGVGRYRFKLFDLSTGTLLHDRTCTVPNLSSAEYDDLT